ncbi:MAG: hypothetical protein H5T99_08040 [Moorella sp. (in: Bacteria)]|nr:hypothetical protein [Moorella sp. (in: firmicutes)]
MYRGFESHSLRQKVCGRREGARSFFKLSRLRFREAGTTNRAAIF